MSRGLIDKALNFLADNYNLERKHANGTNTTDAGGYIVTYVPVATTIPTHATASGGRTALLAAITVGGVDVWCIRVLEKDTLTLCKNTSITWYMGYLELT